MALSSSQISELLRLGLINSVPASHDIPAVKETAVRCGYVLEEAEIILGGILTNLEFELDTLFGLGLLRTCSGLKIFSPKKYFGALPKLQPTDLGSSYHTSGVWTPCKPQAGLRPCRWWVWISSPEPQTLRRTSQR